MNAVDIISLVYVGLGYLMGRKRGLAKEVYRMINMAIVALTGVGLSKWIGKLLSVIPGVSGENSGMLGFVVVVVGTLVLLRVIRRKLRAALAIKFGERAGPVAGAVAAVRYGLVVITVIAGMILAPLGSISKPVEKGSFIGRTVGWFISDAGK